MNAPDDRETTEDEGERDVDGSRFQFEPTSGFGDYMAQKRVKLDAQWTLAASERASDALTGCVSVDIKSDRRLTMRAHSVTIHVNGYTQPSASELRRLGALHGAKFTLYVRRLNAAAKVERASLTRVRSRTRARTCWPRRCRSPRASRCRSTSALCAQRGSSTRRAKLRFTRVVVRACVAVLTTPLRRRRVCRLGRIGSPAPVLCATRISRS